MTHIRPTTAEDAPAILSMASFEPLFSREEANCVEELLTDYLERPDHNGYHFLTAESDGRVTGFACYGPTPMTQGTFDLYWICVDVSARGQGIGKRLISQVEQEIAARRGRLIVIDTSGRPEYAPTRVFYEKMGYRPTARVPEFYGQGDDLVVYTRQLNGA